jgi:hypothetical protein
MIDLTPFANLVPLDHGLSVVVTRRRPQPRRHQRTTPTSTPRHIHRGRGTHDDWATYDQTMRNERRTAVLVAPMRVYSGAPR